MKVRRGIGDLGKDGVEVRLGDGGVELGLDAGDRGRGQHGGDQVVGLVVHEGDGALLGALVLGRGDLLGEVGRDDELHVVAAVFQAVLGVLGVGVHPAHALVRVLHGLYQLVAHLEAGAVVERGPLVEVDYGHGNLVHVSIRVVEGPQVQRAVQKRHERDGRHGDLHDCRALGVAEVEEREADSAERVTHS